MADMEHYKAEAPLSSGSLPHALFPQGSGVMVFTKGLAVEGLAEKAITLLSGCLANLFSRVAWPVGAFFPL